MAVKQLTSTPKKADIRWWTPAHRLYVLGRREDNGKFYVSRGPVPHFIVEGDTLNEVEYEAGRLINAFTIRTQPREQV